MMDEKEEFLKELIEDIILAMENTPIEEVA
jgi:hypothetical protein|nr:MAG TPA: hypothetical protein [Caudoviricetes sp.]